jgi:hypothetical protein
VLDFTMGSRPSAWGTGPDAAPPSLTTGSEVAKPLTDFTVPSGPLTDNNSTTDA